MLAVHHGLGGFDDYERWRACPSVPAMVRTQRGASLLPADGFWHRGASVRIDVTHGRSEIIAPEPLEAEIKA